jgi:ATP-dependent DNA ligase
LLRHSGVDPFRYAFDLLRLDDDDLRGLTLIERVSYEYCSDLYSKS